MDVDGTIGPDDIANLSEQATGESKSLRLLKKFLAGMKKTGAGRRLQAEVRKRADEIHLPHHKLPLEGPLPENAMMSVWSSESVAQLLREYDGQIEELSNLLNWALVIMQQSGIVSMDLKDRENPWKPTWE